MEGGANHMIDWYWRQQTELLGSFGPEQTAGVLKTSVRRETVRRLMREDPGVSLTIVSQEAMRVLCKASDMFVQEVTTRAWHIAQEQGRRVVVRADITAALAQTDMYDFLALHANQDVGRPSEHEYEIIKREQQKNE